MLDTVANWFTIGGFLTALIIAVLTATGFFTSYKIRTYWRHWVLYGVFKYGLLRIRLNFYRALEIISRRALVNIPTTMDFDGFDPNDLKIDNTDRKGHVIRMVAHINPKTKRGETEIHDWKGKAFVKEGWQLEEVFLKSRAYIHKDMNEWKLGVSILNNDYARDLVQEHRLYGENRIAFELSRHHEEGVQAVIAVFDGDPFKIRSAAIKEGDWNEIRIKFKPDKILFCVFADLVYEIDLKTKPRIIDFVPNAIWFVFWADKETEMEVRFSNIRSYWRKN